MKSEHGSRVDFKFLDNKGIGLIIKEIEMTIKEIGLITKEIGDDKKGN